MRVTLVHWSRGDREFHPGVASMSAILKQRGHECRVIVDDNTMTSDDYAKHMKDYAPNLFGFTCMSFQWQAVSERVQWVKAAAPKTPVIVGGYHPTSLPDMVLRHDCVDMICQGEGDEAIVELADKLEKGDDITKIQNIWVKEMVDAGMPARADQSEVWNEVSARSVELSPSRRRAR